MRWAPGYYRLSEKMKSHGVTVPQPGGFLALCVWLLLFWLNCDWLCDIFCRLGGNDPFAISSQYSISYVSPQIVLLDRRLLSRLPQSLEAWLSTDDKARDCQGLIHSMVLISSLAELALFWSVASYKASLMRQHSNLIQPLRGGEAEESQKTSRVCGRLFWQCLAAFLWLWHYVTLQVAVTTF